MEWISTSGPYHRRRREHEGTTPEWGERAACGATLRPQFSTDYQVLADVALVMRCRRCAAREARREEKARAARDHHRLQALQWSIQEANEKAERAVVVVGRMAECYTIPAELWERIRDLAGET